MADHGRLSVSAQDAERRTSNSDNPLDPDAPAGGEDWRAQIRLACNLASFKSLVPAELLCYIEASVRLQGERLTKNYEELAIAGCKRESASTAKRWVRRLVELDFLQRYTKRIAGRNQANSYAVNWAGIKRHRENARSEDQDAPVQDCTGGGGASCHHSMGASCHHEPVQGDPTYKESSKEPLSPLPPHESNGASAPTEPMNWGEVGEKLLGFGIVKTNQLLRKLRESDATAEGALKAIAVFEKHHVASEWTPGLLATKLEAYAESGDCRVIEKNAWPNLKDRGDFHAEGKKQLEKRAKSQREREEIRAEKPPPAYPQLLDTLLSNSDTLLLSPYSPLARDLKARKAEQSKPPSEDGGNKPRDDPESKSVQAAFEANRIRDASDWMKKNLVQEGNPESEDQANAESLPLFAHLETEET